MALGAVYTAPSKGNWEMLRMHRTVSREGMVLSSTGTVVDGWLDGLGVVWM